MNFRVFIQYCRVHICYGLLAAFAGLTYLKATAIPRSFDQLEVAGTLYRQVRVKSVNPHSVVILHSKGLAQLPLESLSEELRQVFGYDPELEVKYLKAAAAQQTAAWESEQAAKRSGGSMGVSSKQPTSKASLALSRFGRVPEVRDEVDLRPQFHELDLYSKHQGLRPSCAVFAVVSALEFQNAEFFGRAEKLSEEYLIWATLESLGLGQDLSATEDEATEDTGFTLLEVVQALITYGIPLQSSMPNTFGKSMAKIETPDPSIITEARNRCQVRPITVTGRDPDTKINNMIQALNTGIPVVIGLKWPPAATLRNAPVLSAQKPREDYAHAVTVVGYRSDNRSNETLRFVFKNSWGNRWGVNGYGWVTYSYLQKHLLSAVILEVSP